MLDYHSEGSQISSLQFPQSVKVLVHSFLLSFYIGKLTHRERDNWSGANAQCLNIFPSPLAFIETDCFAQMSFSAE